MDDPNVDVLQKGLCRPSMFFGVPYLLCLANAVINLIAFIWLKHLAFYLVFPFVLHGIFWLICLRDPFAINVWQTKLTKCPLTLNYWRHGANSYAV